MQKRKPLLRNPIIGADIEVFLQDKTTSEIVSAEGIIQGSKEAPFKFKDGNPYFATSLDNIMVEFNIEPARDGTQFNANIQEALSYVKSVIPQHLGILAFPSARVNRRWFQTENAILFGCEPDFNAWTLGGINPRPDSTTDLRSCGGHLHVGYEQPKYEPSMALIRAMDIHLGLSSILQEPENERKGLYGKPGAFRPKDYGVEYRTISNYYITSSKLTEWAFNNTLEAIEFVNRGSVINAEEAEAIQAAINHNDKDLAQTLCTYFGVKLAE